VDEHEPGGLTPAIFLAGAAGSVLLVGLIGALVALLRGRGYSPSIALAYYFVGSIVFLVGTFPSGGYSVLRGRTRRRPMGGSGPFARPTMLVGLLLIGVGVAVDVTQPF
jgi:hypothetical protein